MQKKLIITIDGGGIRGIIPLIVLRAIQQRFKSDVFKLKPDWWGTSTGAIISSALVVQQSLPFFDAVQNVLDLYSFRAEGAINPKGQSDPTRSLNRFIRHNFTNINLTSFPSLNLVASDADSLEPNVFNADNNADLAQTVLASCAFPGVFPPVEINGKKYVDGFFHAKNPGKLAVEFCQEKYPKDELIVLSLGTGVLKSEDEIETRVQDVHEHLTALSEKGKLAYFRLNPVLNHASGNMQNTRPKNIMNLKKDAYAFLDQEQQLMNKLIESLDKIAIH